MFTFWVGENEFSYSKINGNGNDFIDNLYDLRYQCMVANYLFNNFKCVNFLTSCNWSSLLMWSSVNPKPLNCLHVIFLWWLHGKEKHQK
jgi:hypothetical protein